MSFMYFKFVEILSLESFVVNVLWCLTWFRSERVSHQGALLLLHSIRCLLIIIFY